VLTVIGFGAFIVRELMSRFPIVDLRVFRERTYAAGVLLMTTVGFVLYGSMVLQPVFLQTLMGNPAL
jgi:DHA2 family multidrug resistance protein